MNRRFIDRVTLVIALVCAGGIAVAAEKKTTETWTPPTALELTESFVVAPDGELWGAPVELGFSDGMLLGYPDGGTTLSVSEGAGALLDLSTQTLSYRSICKVARDFACHPEAYRFPVGTAAVIATPPSGFDASVDNWFSGEANHCADGELVGILSRSYDLVPYLEGVRLLLGRSATSKATVYLMIDEHASQDCSGDITRGGYYDQIEYQSVVAQGPFQIDATCDQGADCSGWGDDCGAQTWHLPDILITGSGAPANSYRSYYVVVYARMCDGNGGNCSPVAIEDGCFKVYWY